MLGSAKSKHPRAKLTNHKIIFESLANTKVSVQEQCLYESP